MRRITSDQGMWSKWAAPSGSGIPRYASFDYLRLFAIALVTLQHAMAVAGYYDQTTWANVNLGQIGVSLFCALSGYLAFLSNSAPATVWLKKRLLQIYPAYWIATVAAFLLTWAVGAKRIDWWLFLSQMVGTGYFTHGWELVNVVSWFISLILLCYVIAFFGKWLGGPRLLLALAAIIALALLATHSEAALSRHVLTFCVAALVAQISPRPTAMLVIVASLIGVSLLLPQSFYAAASIALLALALALRATETRLSRIASSYVYEFFLVHGIFLVALARFVPQPKLLSAAIAVVLAIAAAVILKKLTERLVALARDDGPIKAAAV